MFGDPRVEVGELGRMEADEDALTSARCWGTTAPALFWDILN